LLLYAPIAYSLWIADWPGLAFAGLLVIGWTATLPDIDLRVPGLSHRGSTHTVGFAALIAAVWGVIGWVIGTQVTRWLAVILQPTAETASIDGWSAVVAQLGAVDGTALAAVLALSGGVAVLSHLVADLLTPMGIRPFWPISSESYSLGVCRAANRPANALLLMLGVVAIALVAVSG
jgi:inner membrane protein